MSSTSVSTDDPVDKQAYELLRGRTSPEEAITSGEISERLKINDTEANPKTRKLVRELIEDHDLPVISCHAGYYVASTTAEIEEHLSQLDSRIAGIQERKRRIVAAHNRRRYDD